MKIRKVFDFLLIIFILITFTSCGGDGTGIGTTGGGIGGSGANKQVVSKGTITGFGSVIVNGIEFETTGATITTDDNPNAAQQDLGLGMVVTVKGTVNTDGTTGTAESVEFKDNLEGPITSADSTSQTIIVMGQTVVWDSSTICENKSDISINCATLASGNLVEISGFPTISGATTSILATRIELKESSFDPAKEAEVKGKISGLDTTAKTFLIGSQVVNYSTAVFEGVTKDNLADGMFVEVKGKLDLSEALIATRIKLEEEVLVVAENQEAQIEGLVDAFTSCNGSDCIFSISGRNIQTNSATEFKNGAPSDISVGVRLEVEGTINTNGVLIAGEVSFHETRIEIEAIVQSTAPSDNRITLLGITLSATPLTEFEDNSSSNLEPFGLADINPGNFLRIRGHLDNGNVIADRVERRDTENKVLLKGPVGSASNPSLVIIGVTVQTGSGTQFEDGIEQAQFFALVQPGMTVKAKGIFNGSAIIADEVEIED